MVGNNTTSYYPIHQEYVMLYYFINKCVNQRATSAQKNEWHWED